MCGQIHLITFGRATLTENSDPQLQPELTLESCIILPILVPSTLLTQKVALFDLLPSLGLLCAADSHNARAFRFRRTLHRLDTATLSALEDCWPTYIWL